MIQSVEGYLEALKAELKNSDVATVQDALGDAEEHLRAALASLREERPGMPEEELLARVIEQYGSPEETASAYREVERRTTPQLAKENQLSGSALSRFFSVYADPRAWGALLYMLIAFATGVVYFTWAITGLSLSVSFVIFIFGFPFAILFLLSVRGLILIEGRLVEALLGVRMPRRPLFTEKNLKWIERLKQLVTDLRTWLSILYMIIQFVLGTVYFVLIVTVLSFSFASIAVPFVQEILNQAPIQMYGARYYVPTWSYPLFVFGGFLLWTMFMNIARWIGQQHGRMAKALLVTE